MYVFTNAQGKIVNVNIFHILIKEEEKDNL